MAVPRLISHIQEIFHRSCVISLDHELPDSDNPCWSRWNCGIRLASSISGVGGVHKDTVTDASGLWERAHLARVRTRRDDPAAFLAGSRNGGSDALLEAVQ